MLCGKLGGMGEGALPGRGIVSFLRVDLIPPHYLAYQLVYNFVSQMDLGSGSWWSRGQVTRMTAWRSTQVEFSIRHWLLYPH